MKYLSFVFIILVLMSCKTSKPVTEELLVSYKTTACRGKCPEYTLEVYNTKLVKLVATKNLKIQGNYSANLTDSQFEVLSKLIEKCKAEQLDEKYTSKTTDLPTRIIQFSGKKVIMYGKGIPVVLNELESEIKNYVNTIEWKQ
jgi:hypothetical protein